MSSLEVLQLMTKEQVRKMRNLFNAKGEGEIDAVLYGMTSDELSLVHSLIDAVDAEQKEAI